MRVRLRLQVHSCFAALSGGDAMLEMMVDLPVLFCGMSVIVGEDEFTVSAENGGVTVDLQKDPSITVYFEDKELYEAALATKALMGYQNPERLAEIVAHYIARGWEVQP